MRARNLRVSSSKRACSSGVILRAFFFFAIVLLQKPADLADVIAHVHEQAHDSRDVAVANRRLHASIVVESTAPRKMSETASALRPLVPYRLKKGGLMHWVWLIIVGAIVGALGRLLHPGSDPMGWIVTILIGIGSLVIAGLIFSSGILQFVVGVIVAIILVAIVGRFFGERRSILTLALHTDADGPPRAGRLALGLRGADLHPGLDRVGLRRRRPRSVCAPGA